MVVLPKRLPEAELLPMVADAVALVVRSETKVTRKVIEAAPKLRVVGRAGVGVDNVDIEAATQHGTVVMNTPGGNTVTTAELSFAMLLSLARKVPQAHASMVAGKWDRKLFQGAELMGKTLGVLGMGRIGTEVAKRALAFGMRVIAYDPYLTEDRAKAIGAEFADSVDEVYRVADFITVHMPVTPETKHMLNAAAFAKMKPGVRIVNCARGEIIVENDLIAALESARSPARRWTFLPPNPCPPTIRIASSANLILTPHLGASTEEAQEKCGIEVAEVIAGYLLTGEVRNAVNLPYLDAKTYEQVKPYLPLGEALGKLLAQLAPRGRRPHLHHLRRTRAAVAEHRSGHARGFARIPDQQRGQGREQRQRPRRRGGHRSYGRGKKSDEPVTFNEWLHVQVFSNGKKLISAGGTFFGSPNNPAHRAAVQHAGGNPHQRHVAAVEQQGPARHCRLPRHAAGQTQSQHRQHEPDARHRGRAGVDRVESRQRAAAGGAGRTPERPGYQQCESH